MTQQIANLINEGHNRLVTARDDDEIQPILALYGYTPTRLNEGLALLDALEDEAEARVDELGDQYAATDDFEEAWEAAKQVYMRHVELARILFEEDENRMTDFGLRGRRERDISGWLGQARLLYNGLEGDPEAVTQLGALNVSADELTAARALVDDLEARQRVQDEEEGEAEMATQERDAAFRTARRWMRVFNRVATVALAPFPQLREKLGLLERS